MNDTLAGGPDPCPLMAITEQEYRVLGENPATVRESEREKKGGVEEGGGEQERL